MISLAIDASTYDGSVVVVRDGAVAAELRVPMRGVEAEGLMPAVAEVLAQASVGLGELDRIVCGGGPGSFTSLRIAASIAKGLALALGRPLFAVPSLGLLVGGVGVRAGQYVATLDALRGEWYAGVYLRGDDGQVTEIEAPRLMDRSGIDALARQHAGSILGAATAGHVDGPRARAVVALEDVIGRSDPVDLSSWEPEYGRLAQAQVAWEATHGRPLRHSP